jgi:hypothetical protein
MEHSHLIVKFNITHKRTYFDKALYDNNIMNYWRFVQIHSYDILHFAH